MVFEELVKRLTPKLKRITCKLNGRFSSFSHEDLYQEALLHLWLDFKDEKLSNKTGSYILQGCYFYLKNYLRKVCNKVYTISLEQIRKGEDEDLDLGAVSSLEDPRSSLEVGHSKMLMEQIKNNGLTRREKGGILSGVRRTNNQRNRR